MQKNWVKTAIPALSSGQSNLQTPIWGCHRQLDDQYRNPNNNNRDHLVGQLNTNSASKITWRCKESWIQSQKKPLCRQSLGFGLVQILGLASHCPVFSGMGFKKEAKAGV